MKKSILIGSNGYLGKHISHYLDANNFENENVDIHPTSFTNSSNYKSINILNSKDLTNLNSEIDYIFLFAGKTGTFNGFDLYKDFISLNEIGLLNILNWMRKTNCKAKIIFPSTRLVYKGKSEMLVEADDKFPKTLYAVNKLACEQLLAVYQNMFGINYTIFRICVPYGNLFDKLFSYGTIGFFLNKALKGEDISLFGDGSIRRTFSHVEDICANIMLSLKNIKTNNDVFNIGGEDFSLFDVAKLIAEKYNVSVQFSDWPEQELKLESGDTVFNSAKLDTILNYKIKNSIAHWVANL